MARTGPIIIIDDDKDDRDLLAEVFASLEVINKLKFFESCTDAYTYLKTTRDKPFIIFSDINVPGMSGAELKRLINQDPALRRKSIPYIFLSTTTNHAAVLESYENLSQGFFSKPNDFKALVHMVEMILNYWKIARHPNADLL
ncbi:response regulator [Flaviaesturariibacter amylovorans]|uniref:Response regulatory domain-containing protein n=1 Tax=Flaviaesturariibacter amylovorans TaxID=1084520 RepID=A0ABP8HF19_9BACT